VVGLPIDAANPNVYSDVKQGELASQLELINQAAGEFEGRISTHIMIGLGESEKDVIRIMKRMHKLKVTLALFAFTPIKGTPLEAAKQPAMEKYRRIQVAKLLIERDISPDFEFDDKDNIIGYGFGYEELKERISASAFMTTGCDGCNRPYYNEKPGGTLYNYPYTPSSKEYKIALKDAWIGSEVQYG
jgi:biotin synthase